MFRPLLFALGLALCAAPASAITMNFSCLTNFNECPAGASKIELGVFAGGTGSVYVAMPGQVELVVRNLTSNTGIEAAYVSASSLIAGVASVTNTAAVSFVQGVTDSRPAVLPGGGAFSWPTVLMSTGSGLKAPEYVGPGEDLVIVLDLIQGTTAQAVIAALQSGAIRVGVLLNDDGLITVPEPAAIFLLGAAALAVGRRRRQR